MLFINAKNLKPDHLSYRILILKKYVWFNLCNVLMTFFPPKPGF